jgi:hypothetical protein
LPMPIGSPKPFILSSLLKNCCVYNVSESNGACEPDNAAAP